MGKTELTINPDTFTNEMKLLLLCSIKDLSSQQEEKIRSLLNDDIDWGLFLKLVAKHRIHTLVYSHLTRIDSPAVNKKALKTLEQRCQKNLMDAVKQTGELISLARLMAANGIRAFSLKGPLLARTIYGDIAYRKSKDLDILICEQDIEKTAQLLLANGYKNADLEVDLSPKQKAHIIKTNHHFVYQKPTGVIVELHWRDNSESNEFQFEELWHNRRELVLSGQTINVLAAEDEFLYLLRHGSIHGYNRLRWLCDIAEIIKSNQLDWSGIVKRATKLDIMETLVQAIILCDRLLTIAIPEVLWEPAASNRLGQKMAIMALPFIIEPDEKAIGAGGRLDIYFRKYTLLRSKGIKAKGAYLMARFYPGLIDYEAIDFNDRFFFMYYLTRPFFKMQRIMNRSS